MRTQRHLLPNGWPLYSVALVIAVRARSGDNRISPLARDDANIELESWGQHIQLLGGGLDTTFTPDAPNGTVRAIAVDSDKRILIAGDFTEVGGQTRNRIARLNSDGTLDTGFNPGSGANGAVHSVVVQPDGKILIGGEFMNVAGQSRARIARLNAGGNLDTFNPGANGTVHSIVVQPDGKTLFGGAFTTVAGQTRNRIARLSADGSLDSGFNPGVSGGAAPVVYSIALQMDADGKGVKAEYLNKH